MLILCSFCAQNSADNQGDAHNAHFSYLFREKKIKCISSSIRIVDLILSISSIIVYLPKQKSNETTFRRRRKAKTGIRN